MVTCLKGILNGEHFLFI